MVQQSAAPGEPAGSPAGVLAAARRSRLIADREEARILALAVDWAAMHPVESIAEAARWATTSSAGAAMFGDRGVPVAGEGAPLVAEFSIPEFAAALGMSTDAGRALVGEAVELAHRLPLVWGRVVDGELAAWRARRIARSTLALPMHGARFVDRQVSGFAATVSLAQLDRLVEEALVRFAPQDAAERRRAAADGRHVTVHTAQVGFDGTVLVEGELDLADALDLDAAVSAGAARLAALGSSDSLDVRRAVAMGEIARRDLTLPLPAAGADQHTAEQGQTGGRQVVLHVHLARDALSPAGQSGPGGFETIDLARVDNSRSFVDAGQVRDWCGTPGTRVIVKPVIDLDEHLHTDAYQTPGRLAEQSGLVDHTCVFPWCTRPARPTETSSPTTPGADCDHVVPYERGGPTCSCNIARLCRRHHRLKTHTGWTYLVLERGSYLWTSPHGYRFLRDGSGTRDATPSPTRGHQPTGHHLLTAAAAPDR